MVAEPRQPLQPQQGHAELSSHLLQLSSADLKTLKRTCTCTSERISKNMFSHHTNLQVQYVHTTNMQLNSKK